MGKNKNFKSKVKLMTILITIIILILAVILISLKIREKNNVFSNSENISDAREVGYQKLDEKDFKIDTEKNEITFGENTKVGTFCISESPDGPTEDDKWIVTSGEKTVKLEESSNGDNEIKKKYVYYLASNYCSMSNYDSSKSIFTIRNETELKEFASKVNSGISFSGKTVYLISDIALSGSSNNHTSIGTSSNPFKGTFDGNGYTISNIQISKTSSNYIGLFGYVNGGTIRNVIIKTGSITGKEKVGGIVGYLGATSIVEQCHNQGVTVKGTTQVGGIVGYYADNSTFVKFCSNYATVNGSAAGVGGIVGSSSSNMYNLNSTGNIRRRKRWCCRNIW